MRPTADIKTVLGVLKAACAGMPEDDAKLLDESFRSLVGQVAVLRAALRPFAREHSHAEIATRAAFAHAAELLKQRV